MLRFLLVLILLLQPLGSRAMADESTAPAGIADPSEDIKDKRRVLVLPFETPNSQADIAGYGPGMMDSLISGLKTIPQFIIIDRSRVDRAIRAQALSLADPKVTSQVGKILSAQTLITGSIQTSGTGSARTVQITANFVDVESAVIQASERVRGPLGRIFDLQNDLANKFIQQQRVVISAAERARVERILKSTGNLSAYDNYLLGRQAFLLFTPAGYQQAVQWYHKAIAADPKYALAHAALAEAWSYWAYDKQHRGEVYLLDYEKAYVEAEQALALNPDLAAAHRAFGRAAGMLKKPGRVAEGKKALALDPNDAENWLELWYATSSGPNPDDYYLQKALKLNPDLVPARIDRGIDLKNLKRYDEAIAEYKWVLRLNPDDQNAHNNLAIVYKIQQRFADAMAEYREALRVNPKDPLFHSNLGNLLYAEGRYEEAVAEQKEAIRLNSYFADAYYNLGYALGKLRRHQEAGDAFELYLKYNTNGRDVEHVKIMIQKIRALPH